MTVGDHVTSNMKYKYVIALDYAFANYVQPKILKTFLRKQGGFNNCVELWKKNMVGNLEERRERKNHEFPVINRGGCHSPELTLADGFRLATRN